MATELPHIDPGTIVTAADWWNPLTDAVNQNSSASETNQSGLKQTNQKLTSVTDRVSTAEDRLGDGIGTSSDGSGSSGTAGAQLAYLRARGGGEDGGGAAGTIRFRAVLQTAYSLSVGSPPKQVQWSNGAEYADGIELVNPTDFRIDTPGVYVAFGSLCAEGTITTGKRFQLWVGPSDNQADRRVAGQYALPNHYPLVSLSGPFLVTEPGTFSMWTWIDANTNPKLYTNYNYCAVSIAYIGG